MWSWRAMFAGVMSSSRATCPNTEMRRRDRRWDSEVRPVRWSTSSFRTQSYHRIPSSCLRHFWWKASIVLTSADRKMYKSGEMGQWGLFIISDSVVPADSKQLLQPTATSKLYTDNCYAIQIRFTYSLHRIIELTARPEQKLSVNSTQLNRELRTQVSDTSMSAS